MIIVIHVMLYELSIMSGLHNLNNSFSCICCASELAVAIETITYKDLRIICIIIFVIFIAEVLY